jgi:PHP family Zn ribbon phosphoesterase
MSEDYHLPICTCCYSVRVEPQRAKTLRPTCMACGETLARQVRHTVAPMNKSNYMLFTDPELLKQLNPKRTM